MIVTRCPRRCERRAAIAGAARIALVSISALLAFAGCTRRSWHEIPVVDVSSPAREGSMLPHLATQTDEAPVLSWVEGGESGPHSLRYSVLEGSRWSEPRTVASGQDWFVNWADFPTVVPIDATHWAAHWLVKRAGGKYAYDIAVSVSADAGRSWGRALTPHLDGTPTEHGFVSIFPAAESFGLAWLDGRETGGGEHHAGHGAAGTGAMTLRFASIAFDGDPKDEARLDARVCDCCQTTAAWTPRGVLVAYRDRAEDELRDISVVRLESSGWRRLAGPEADRWKIDGCPVNGPAIDASGERVALAWFTAADERPRVTLSLSTDAGDAFGQPIPIDENALGRVDVIALEAGGAIVSWLAATDKGAEIRLRRVDGSGAASPIRTVASTEPARSSGFPQLGRRGDDLIVAWTAAGEMARIRTVVLAGAAR